MFIVHRNGFALLCLPLAVLTMTSCSRSSAEQERVSLRPDKTAGELAWPSADPALGESAWPREQELGKQIADVIEKSISEKYRNGTALRDAHPKAHGCVSAEFQVNKTLPASLAQGIFIPGKTYPAWIRFSNGNADASRADTKADARGMAIKVMQVPGKKLLESEQDARTQDFIMINHPVFFANDPARYLSLMEKTNSESFFSKLGIPFALGFKGSVIAIETINNTIANPLSTRYWSMVPYQLGTGPARQAVKFSARACTATKDRIHDQQGHDYLRDAMRVSLSQGEVCMEFLVQPRTSEKMSVEDAMTEWSEKEAPFYKVATLRIPRQVFDTPEQNRFCENLSFTPWHALPAHKPLGVTNRLRKVIYERISQKRHEMNGVGRNEP